ncbi:MAG: restriction endonuclease subunit S [Nitrosomonas sp.]|nr:restriction endonuclease subunit S [Nitrosomonas sp.]MBP7113309.1 restriction endonuclease subunit S [Nitrosomonas sp.]
MRAIQQILIDHIDIWTTAETEKKSGRGRGSSNSVSVYGIKKLRELILELAVRGKLVPQDANDEPASELLKRIRAEKAKLMAEGKIKKDKPLALITDEEKPFELPREWEWVRFGETCSYIQRGKGPVYVDNSEFLVISQKCVRWSGLDLTQARFIDPESVSKYEAIRLLCEGDVLWNSTGTGTIGRACLVPPLLDQQFLVADSHVTVVRPIGLWSVFLCRWIESPSVQSQIEGVASGTTNQIELNTSTVITHPLPLPPLAEQHRIVAKVDELMALCDQLEAQHNNAADAHEKLVSHLLDTLTRSQSADDFSANWQRIAAHFDTLFTAEASIDALKQTLLQLAVMGKLVPQDPNDEPASELLKRIQAEKAKLIAEGKIKKDKPLPPITDEERPFELPQGWEWARLGELASRITKGSSPKWQGVSYTDNPQDVMFVTSENVGSYSLLLDTPKYVEKKFNDIEPRSILAKGDFLMNIVGASIGRTAVYNIDALANINQAVCLIRISSSNLLSMFLLHFFNSETCLEYMFDKQVDNARPNLSMGNISKFLIPIPPLLEQHRVVTKIDELMTLCDQLKSRITQASQLQQNLADMVVEQSISSNILLS